MSKICPKCNKVFDDDVTVCPDCQVELTPQTGEDAGSAPEPQQEEKQVSVFSLTNEESAQRVIEYMKEQGIDGEYRYNFRERTFKIFVAQSDARNALRACTSFYAEEAKRLKAEEDKKREEEEAARRKAEEEERKKREEEERLKREAEEAERKKREAEEAARKAAEAEAIRKAEEESKRKAAEAERVRREAEEAVRKAEEAAKKIEEEAKRAAEEEAKRKAAEEEEKRKVAEAEAAKQEEERKRQEARENRRKMFEAGIREAEAQKQEERKKKFAYIPHVEGETVQEESDTTSFYEDIQPEAGPIFVETEPVDEYEVGDTIVVDAVEVESSDIDDFYNTTEEEPVEEESSAAESSSVFPDFMSNIKSSKNIGGSPLFGGSFDDGDEDEEENVSSPFSINTQEKPQKPLVEDMFTDNVFSSTDKPLVEEPAPDLFSSAPVEEYKEETKETIEEVINDQLKSSPAVPRTAAPKKDDLDDVLDDGLYKGFVPDYHQEEEEVVDEDALLAQSYGFDPDEYKKLKAKAAKKAQERKSNPPKYNRAHNNKDFIVVDEPSLDDRMGFVPDYSAKDEEKLEYYTKRTTIDYSKYRSNSDEGDRGSLANLNATLRASSQTELSRLFENDILKIASKPQDYVALKSSTYILAMTGGQLNSLFTSWLMTNCTAATVKQYVKESATPDENYVNKIEGIKNLLKQNFGKLDDVVLDIIVKKFYNKYLDD